MWIESAMRRPWLLGKRWIAMGAAAWLAGGSVLALSLAGAAEPAPANVGRSAPGAVANPFAVSAGRAVRQPPAIPFALPTDPRTSTFPAAAAEAEAPATYRVPGASSFAPAPVVPIDAESTPEAASPLPAPPTQRVAIEPEPVSSASPSSEVAPAVEQTAEQAMSATSSAEDTVDTAEAAAPSVEPASPPVASETPADGAIELESADALSTPWPNPHSTHGDSDTDQRAGGVPDADSSGQAPTPPSAPHPMTTEMTPQLRPAVQRGYALAQRGAMFAARSEFVHVLRRIVQAKDAAANSDFHSQALAAGLRAIDEAEDFVPSGVQVEAELDVRIVSSSHRTPVLRACRTTVSPHEAVALYHRYAQEQLAAAVAGEQAGSMALHGLGKVSATLAERGNGDPALVRNALTMYTAALATCPTNHLAANELGVLLVRSGRADEAARLFERTIDMAPTATAYHNLSVAQGKLGFQGEAAANEQESQRLATIERSTGAVSRRVGVEWVTPEQMSGVTPLGMTPTAQVPPRPRSTWEKTVDMAKSLPFVGGTKTR